MRKILDKMFQYKKLSIFVPMTVAALVYLFFMIFGTAENKVNLLIETPIICVCCFFGVFMVVFAMVKNSMWPEWLLNFYEFFAVIISGVISLIGIISFITSGFQDFGFELFFGMVIFSGVSLAHSKRTD